MGFPGGQERGRSRSWYGLAVLVVFLLAHTWAFAADFSGRVVRVADGDTVEVLREGTAVRIRLVGIDAPEQGQPYGGAAKRFVLALVGGQTVTVAVTGEDRYGRTLGDLLLPDGRSLSRELVRAGLAWWYRRYAPDARDLEELENEARAARRGLWQERDPIPPWEWRRQRRGSRAR